VDGVIIHLLEFAKTKRRNITFPMTKKASIIFEMFLITYFPETLTITIHVNFQTSALQ
jgi:hypothetical protein